MSYTLHLGDCLEVMPTIPAGSVDAIIADWPYGTTACKWDSIISLEPLWKECKRVIRRNGAIVLMASQPFTTVLIASSPYFGTKRQWFKYCWYWHKNIVSGFQLAKIQPTRAMEEICVFYQDQPTYNRQPTESIIRDRKRIPGVLVGNRKMYQKNNHKLGTKPYPNIYSEYVAPRNVLEIPCVPRGTGTLHPTQKPVALMEYLIKTYTNPDDLVLDNTFGSCSTGEAALRTDRRFIGIEKDPGYFEIGRERMRRVEQELKEAQIARERQPYLMEVECQS